MTAPPVSAISNLLQTDGCDWCGGHYFLYARVNGERICAACWKAAGRPVVDDIAPAYELETRTRERMQERGGADRYRVKAGKS